MGESGQAAEGWYELHGHTPSDPSAHRSRDPAAASLCSVVVVAVLLNNTMLVPCAGHSDLILVYIMD